MDIIYKNKNAKEQFCSNYNKKWKYPTNVAEALRATELYIRAAASLQDIFNYPPFHFHPLKGNRKGEWSIRLKNTGYRITLVPCDVDGKAILTGDILLLCKTIKIIMVTEVSNHYE